MGRVAYLLCCIHGCPDPQLPRLLNKVSRGKNLLVRPHHNKLCRSYTPIMARLIAGDKNKAEAGYLPGPGACPPGAVNGPAQPDPQYSNSVFIPPIYKSRISTSNNL